MNTAKPRKIWMVLGTLLFVAPVLSGCFGSDDAPDASEQGNDGVSIGDTGGGGGTNLSNGPTDHSGAKNEPSAHYHHYWGNPAIPQVIIYDGIVPFNNVDNKYLLSHRTMAWSEFNLETDNDDVSDPINDQPVTSGGKADVVFAGADRVTVRFPDTFPPGVDQLLFQYKSSGTPKFLPENGATISPNQVYTINIDEVGMSDPPHQFTASRWKFRLFATNEICSNFGLTAETCPPTVIQDQGALAPGSVYEWPGLQMIAHNGGIANLDPPHPNFWIDGDVVSLSQTEGEVTDMAVQTPLVRERVGGLTEIKIPPNNIVPLGTEKVVVRVKWTNSAPEGGDDFRLALKYHGADTLEYQFADPPQEADGWQVYEIYDTDGTLVDPPYESNSFWRFQLVPTTTIGGTDYPNTGAFQGTWEMQFEAHKKPGFILE